MRRISVFFALLSTILGGSMPAASGVSAALPAQPRVPDGWARVEGDLPSNARGAKREPAASTVRTLRSTANGRYVSAQIRYAGDDNGMLRARATRVGARERFNLFWDEEHDAYVLRSSANDRYVSVEINYKGADNGMLRARHPRVGEWEQFELYRNEHNGRYSLMSKANRRFVSAELGYHDRDYGMLRARATTIDAWEEFQLS